MAVIIVMGVAGAGKTTIGRALAEALGYRFADADEFHSAGNVEKMSRGIALTETDREPWLQAMAAAIDTWLRENTPVVLACSALKARYRGMLQRDRQRVRVVYLKVSPEVARERVAGRVGHFMKDHLVDDQFETLEEPTDALIVDGAQPPDEIVRRLVRELNHA
jgi:gluconokinase